MTPSSDKLLQISTGLSSSLTKLLGKTIPAIPSAREFKECYKDISEK
jgi:hypothetical protein